MAQAVRQKASTASNVSSSTTWRAARHYGINEGPTVLMIENYRSGMIWSLMRKCQPLMTGLKGAGFSGGWLS
jgi:hypothetical protein